MKIGKIKMHKNAIKRFDEILEILGQVSRELSSITEELERYECMNDVRRKVFDNIKDTVFKAYMKIDDERMGHAIILMDNGVAY